jgi:hypothetical protein
MIAVEQHIPTMTSTLTHPEWNQETSGLAVAEAFADQIRGKDGKVFP